MTHTERVDAVLAGEPVDRPPVSFWRHFYLAERTGQGLAQAMLYFWRRYQWDFLKVNPRSSYQAEVWGVVPKYGSDEHTKEELAEWPVRETADWAQITPRSATIETVFSPLATLGKLAGSPDLVKQDMVEAPEAIHAALAAVSETLSAYVGEVLQVADGIFYATTIWAAAEHLTPKLYEEFGRPYDLQVLSHAQEARLNVLHVCQPHNFVRDLVDYPVHAINWNVYAAGNADLLEVARLTDKVLIGGVDHERVLFASGPDDVRAHIEGLLAGERPPRFIIGPGCVIDTRTRDANLTAVKAVLPGLGEGP
jgi:uroporphyrinogen decarboxylase